MTDEEPSPLARHIAEAQQAETLLVEVTGTLGEKYTVRHAPHGKLSCTCPAFKYGMGEPCKHCRHVSDCVRYRCLICKEARCNGLHT